MQSGGWMMDGEGMIDGKRKKRGGIEKYLTVVSKKASKSRAKKKIINPGEGQVWLGLGSSWKLPSLPPGD